MSENTSGFRLDINALRALAVLAVIAYHFKAGLTGGFAGVDVFFVISGYLMTKIIVEGLSNQKFSLLGFYRQRMRRILPALVFLVLVISAICFFIYLPQGLRSNTSAGLASLLFYSNFFYWSHTGYFDPSADTNIFLHTWSLSVEWQFYLLYPLLLTVLARFKNKAVTPLALGILTLIGAALCFKIAGKFPTANFYLLPPRAWELTAGGLVFFAPGRLGEPVKKTIAIIGYLGIFITFFLIKNPVCWPGVFTLLPVISTAMVLVAGFNGSIFVSSEPIQFIGKISYSLYLWHWPLYVLLVYTGVQMTGETVFLLCILTCLCAVLSYHLIEKRKWATTKLVISWALSAAICFGLSKSFANSFLFNTAAIHLDEYAQRHNPERIRQFSQGKCFISEGNIGLVDFLSNKCLSLDPVRPNYILIGDSHGADLAQSLIEQLGHKNIHVMQATASGCFPLLNTRGVSRCTEVVNFVYKRFLTQNAGKIKGVILSANWFHNEQGLENTLVEDLDTTINYLIKKKLRVIVIGQNEIYALPYPSIAARQTLAGSFLRKNFIVKDAGITNALLSKRFPNQYVSIYNEDTIPAVNQGRPYMFDDNHFSKYGADLAVQKMLKSALAITFFK